MTSTAQLLCKLCHCFKLKRFELISKLAVSSGGDHLLDCDINWLKKINNPRELRNIGVGVRRISSLKRIGRFSVLGLERIEDNDLKVDCIWVSGSNSGRRFQLFRVRTFDDLRKAGSDTLAPSHVYRQSALIVFVLQFLALLGLKALYDFILFVWTHLRDLFKDI